MTEEPIINAEKLFESISNMTNEIKRTILGRYEKDKYYSTDLTKCIYIYNGCNKCNNKISFTNVLSQCKYCESFSLLTEDGMISDNKEIVIQTGQYKGIRIVINKFPRCNSPRIGLYEYKPIVNKSLLLTTIIPSNTSRLISNSCNVVHHIVMSVLLNSLQLSIKSSIFGTWVCETINTVSYSPIYGNLYNATFTKKLFYDVFLQMMILSQANNFFIGDVDTDTFSFGNFHSKYVFQSKKEYNVEITLFIKPNEYSAFKLLNYEGKDLMITGPNTLVEVDEPNWGFYESFSGHSDMYPRSFYRLTNNPSMSDYVKKRIILFKVNQPIIDYIRKTGINALPTLNLVKALTVLLLNRSFYECFVASPLFDRFKKIFTDDNFDKYITIIHSNFGRRLSADDINNLLINSDVGFRFDGYYIFSLNFIDAIEHFK